jgi:benzoylformate decarboxylase
MPEKTGRFAIIEQLLADGFTHMFGNPGTVEQGFLDALAQYPEMQYVLTLQETIAVLMADGYARAARKPALVQIHSTPGLGNSIGALYQAKRGHSPLVVIGGDAGAKYLAMDAQMAGDLVAMAEPVTKWSTMVVDPSSTLRVLRRAIKIAATPPMGPVYVCLPQDILDAPLVEEVRPTSIPSTRVLPDPALLEEAARLLVGAERPRIYMGDGVAFSGAESALVRVAELLGAQVYGADAGEMNMPFDHPLYMGSTGHMFGSHSLPIMQEGDVNLVVGTYVLPEVFPILGDIFASDAKVIHIDLNAYEIAKNHPVDLGMLGDPKVALERLGDLLEAHLSESQRQSAQTRISDLASASEKTRAAEIETDLARRDDVPLHFSRFMEELAPHLPGDAIIFDEALTNSPALTRYVPPSPPRQFYQTRGGSLGVGFPGAIGAKFAHPDKTVIGLSGDGGSMYTIQALWTAARHDVDVTFIVCNNGSYRLLQLNIDAYWKEQDIDPHDHPIPFDLSYPPIHFADLARGMGVQAVRVEKPWEVENAVKQAINHPGPFLIDVVLEGDIHPELIGVHCGQ